MIIIVGKHTAIDISLNSQMDVQILTTLQKGYFLWLYTRFWYSRWLYTVISCTDYSQITVGNVTLPKAVLSTFNIFAVYLILRHSYLTYNIRPQIKPWSRICNLWSLSLAKRVENSSKFRSFVRWVLLTQKNLAGRKPWVKCFSTQVTSRAEIVQLSAQSPGIGLWC